MIVLPIVARELLVASRRRGTYWVRSLAAGAALIFCGVTLMTLSLVPSFSTAGGRIFTFLSWVGLIFVLLIGVSATADSLSREKREGTLGLLFLTDLTGYDVVLGKLAAATLAVFYGLVAMLPILALPLMLGGVTGGEYWRMTLVWLNGLLFSVSAGMCVSAWCRDERVAIGNSFALLLGFVLALPLGGALLATRTGNTSLALPFMALSPLTLCQLAFETSYRTQVVEFWSTLGLTHFLSWLMLWSACVGVRRSVHEQAPRRRRRTMTTAPRVRSGPGRFRRQALEQNPIFWLLSRVAEVRWYPWALVLSLVAVWYWGTRVDRGMFALQSALLIGWAAHFLFKWWVVTVASRNFSEERSNGSIELLLSTPLSTAEVLRGTVRASLRIFVWPVATLIGLELLLLWIGAGRAWQASEPLDVRYTLILMILFNVVVFVADCWALHWVGLLGGFQTRSSQGAVWRALIKVLALPWLGVWSIVALATASVLSIEGMGCAVAWMLLSFAFDVGFGLRARSRLRHHLRELAVGRTAERAPAPA